MSFKVTRMSGDVGCVGEVLIQDWDNDLEWQGRVIESGSKPGVVVASQNEYVCLDRDIQPGVSLRGNLNDAVRDFLDKEICFDCKKPTGLSGDDCPLNDDGKPLCEDCYDRLNDE